jgi:RNA polymerase sigma factor (sigma-70 family)
LFSLSKYTTLAKLALAKTKNPTLLSDENIGYVASFAMNKDKQYNPDRCSSKLKFTRIMMNYAVGKVIEKKNKESNVRSNMDEYLYSKSTKNTNPETIVSNKELIDIVRNQLSAKQFSFLEKHFIEGRTLEEIGNEFGCTRENIRQQVSKALANARRILE